MSRPLAPDEAALWARVEASAKPLAGRRPKPVAIDAAAIHGRRKPKLDRPTVPTPVPLQPPRPRPPGETLDAGWDKRLARGAAVPDSILDLHGHTLASAHALLDHGLGEAIARGDRVLLLVTGRPPRAESERPHARGAIRASIADWLARSRHAGRIAAVRGAHPRHGGAGALYIVLRRARGLR